MKHLIIVGCGSHAAEIVDYIDNTNKHYIHYNYKEKFLGEIDNHPVEKDVYYVMGIGNLSIRAKVLQQLKLKGASFTTIIHPQL